MKKYETGRYGQTAQGLAERIGKDVEYARENAERAEFILKRPVAETVQTYAQNARDYIFGVLYNAKRAHEAAK